MTTSLRARLMLGIGTAAALVLLASMGLAYVLVKSALIDEFDTSLIAQAHSIAAMTEVRDHRILVDAEPGELPEFTRRDRPEYFQLFDDHGESIVRSPSLAANRTLPWKPGQSAIGRMHLPDGPHGRYVTYHYSLRSDDEARFANFGVTVVVTRDTIDLEHTLEHIGALFTFAGALATVAIVTITVLLINRGLVPLRRLSVQIASIDIQHLGSRLEARGLPSELTPIVSRLNDLFQRLQDAFERERSFTADAAHELRTPLAGLESALDVCASRRREPEAYHTVIKQCLGVVRSMHDMVEGLLLLARADARQVPKTIEPVGVEELLQVIWRDFDALATSRSLQIQWETAAELLAETDRAKLRHILSNLLDNAVQYADQGGTVRITTDRQNTQARIRISNTGSQVAAADAEKVFERFWRGDQSRTTTTGTHCGLGLAVCARLASVLGGTISASSEVGGEFTIELRLAAAKVQPAAEPIAPSGV